MSILHRFVSQEDKGHVMGGALSMKWEGRGPLLVVAEILPLHCG